MARESNNTGTALGRGWERHGRLSVSRSYRDVALKVLPEAFTADPDRVVTHEQLDPERSPRTQPASICHSGSLRLSHRRGPLWV